MEARSELSGFFYPESIAVVGVSPEDRNLGKIIFKNCLTFGYRGEIIPVGLKKGVIFGQKIFQSIEDIDRDVQLAVILTPAKTIPGILEQCGRKGIKKAVIESSGFSELGEEGKPLERACLETAGKYGIRFIGPNGIGVTNLENGLVLPFMPLRQDLTLGPVSILAQSGGVGLSYLEFLAEDNIGINKFVSLGNKLNVDENDLLEYLIHDPGTKMILVYLEGFKNGRRFLEIASGSEKPILVHKSNRFRTSSHIAHSHTAALFTDDGLVDDALEQAGCVRVNTMENAMEYIKSLTLPPLRGKRLAVVSRSGGHAVIAADACAYYGFELPHFPEVFLKKFESRFRAHVIRLQNPLDLGDLFEHEFYETIVEEMLRRDDVDGVLLGHGYSKGLKQEAEASREMFKKIEQLVDRYKKPVALFILTEAVERNALKRNLKIPVFAAPENAMKAFNLSHRWATRNPAPLQMETVDGMDTKKAAALLRTAKGRESLLLSESMDLLEAYGFNLPDRFLADSVEKAVLHWKALKGPAAMKINRPHFSHKSDRGALRLNLDSEDRVRAAFHDLRALAGEGIEVLLQPMVARGKEVILGGKQDHAFGPVILFGLGGIFVEVLGDVVFRVAPINREGARRMIQSIKGVKILQGFRGEGPFDFQAVEEALLRLSHLMVDFPDIREIDINPIMVSEEGKGARVLDARVILTPAEFSDCGKSL
ncbi:MAG: acetate--CoA ligase family protein [Pseudomonadota bacterium]